MSLWAREILDASPREETQEELVDRVLQIEANRASAILEGCARRRAGGLGDALMGIAAVLRVHLGQPTPEPPEVSDG